MTGRLLQRLPPELAEQAVSRLGAGLRSEVERQNCYNTHAPGGSRAGGRREFQHIGYYF